MPRSAAQLQATLDAYYAAQTALAQAASYTLDTGQGRYTVTRADLPSINATIQTLEAELAEVTGGNVTVKFNRGT